MRYFSFESEDMEMKPRKLNRLCRTVGRVLSKKTRKETLIKLHKNKTNSTSLKHGHPQRGEAKYKNIRSEFSWEYGGYRLKYQIRNTVIINELNIFKLNIIIQNNGIIWIHHVEIMEPENIPKQLMNYTEEEQGTLDVRSYAGRTNLLYRGMERIEMYKP
jgi:hypothetical protein